MGRIEGKGILYSSFSNERYEGSFKNGLKDGEGVWVCGEELYCGQWKNGQMNGKGKY